MVELSQQAALILILPLLAGLAACGSGNSAQPTPSDDTALSVSDEALGQMVLRSDQLLPEAQGFQPNAKNGVLALDAVANQALDPDTRRADLQKFGWSSAYDASYTDPQAAARTVGVFFVDSEVDLFATAAGASGMFEQDKADLSQQVGKTKDRVTLNNVQLFDATVADQATGASFSLTVQRTAGPSREYRQIAVGFRRGRIVGNVTIGTLDTNDHEAARLEGWAEELARRLNAQIATVLSQSSPSASEATTTVDPIAGDQRQALTTSASRLAQVQSDGADFAWDIQRDGFNIRGNGTPLVQTPGNLDVESHYRGNGDVPQNFDEATPRSESSGRPFS